MLGRAVTAPLGTAPESPLHRPCTAPARGPQPNRRPPYGDKGRPVLARRRAFWTAFFPAAPARRPEIRPRRSRTAFPVRSDRPAYGLPGAFQEARHRPRKARAPTLHRCGRWPADQRRPLNPLEKDFSEPQRVVILFRVRWRRTLQSSGQTTRSIRGGDARRFRAAARIATRSHGPSESAPGCGGTARTAAFLASTTGRNR